MRLLKMSLAMATALVGVGGATVAAAQQAATPGEPSVAGYLCTFAGKCGGGSAGAEQTMAAPRTKGFRLARAVPTTATSATTGAGRIEGAHHYAGGRARRLVPDDRAAARLTRAPAAIASVGSAPVVRPRADLMIEFDRNSARISLRGLAAARVFAQSLVMPELASKRFVIEGHTDMRGSRALNLDLSTRRAQAVADFLSSRGVDKSRLTVRGVGPDQPLPGHRASDPDNRRVEAELNG